MSHYSVIKKTETDTAYISLGNDGVLRILLKKDIDINVEALKANILAVNELVQNEKYAFLYYTEDGSITHTNDARAYGKQNEKAVPKLCTAVVVNNLAHKLIANFYVKFNRPAIPFKVFDKMEEAEEWCKVVYLSSVNKKTFKHTNNTEIILN